MAVDLRDLFQYWETIGVFDVLLPFFLLFAVSYAILDNTKILKDKKINVIVSVIIGILFVQNPYLVGMLHSFVPNVSLTLIVILMAMLVAGLFMGPKGPATGAYGIAAAIAVIFVLWALNAQTGGYALGISDYFDSQTINTIALVAIFVGVIFFVTRDSKQGGNFWGKFEEAAGKLWGK